MKHNPRCPFCGAPTRAQPFRDRTAYQCTECASLSVGPEVATELLLVMTGTPAGAPARRAPRRSRSMPLVTLALALVSMLVAVPVAVAVFGAVATSGQSRAPVEVPVVVNLPPTPVVQPVALPAPHPVEPLPAEVAEAPPAPAPRPDGARGDGAAPAPKSARQAIDLGWKRLDADPSAAAAAFREALEREPGNAEAQYGLGYAQLQLGDKGAATRNLCASVKGGSKDMRREVESLISHHGLACP